MELRDKNGLTEKEYLETFNNMNYPKPSLTADIVVFGKKDDALYLLLIKRGGHPFLSRWALPGGFADPDEPSETTAARELEEETALSGLPLFPVGFYSEPGRDPRGWTVSMAYTSVIDLDKYAPKAGDDAAETGWFRAELSESGFSLEYNGIVIEYEVTADPLSFTAKTEDQLAFDHYRIIYDALRLIKSGHPLC